jgi:hypothetical protein
MPRKPRTGLKRFFLYVSRGMEWFTHVLHTCLVDGSGARDMLFRVLYPDTMGMALVFSSL